MKKLKYKQVGLILTGILLILFIVKVIFFFTAKPKITVDYVAQFNRMSRPKNGDPSDNAAFLYQKAYDAFIGLPEELYSLKQWADFNNQEKELLKNWLASNAAAFEYFEEATSKPYCWIERVSSDKPSSMGGIRTPESEIHRKLLNALVWNARLHAVEGQFKTAFEELLVCYRSGKHLCRPNRLLLDQYWGLRVKNIAVEHAFFIIENYNVGNNALLFLQNALKEQSANDSYLPSMQTEKYSAYDILQRTFIDNGRGTGRWAWSSGWPVSLLLTDKSPLQEKYEEIKERLYCCLIGPTRNDIMNQIERMLDLSEQVMSKTPWQIKNEKLDCFDEIEKIENSHVFFAISYASFDPKGILYEYYQTRAQTDALIAALAIMRYRNNIGQLPESLDKLITAGYLRSVPNDPYSNGPLIYKLTEEDFKLYSVGEDFTDNGGGIQMDRMITPITGFDGIGMIPPVPSRDIIYWPTKETYARRQDAIYNLFQQAMRTESVDYDSLFLELKKLGVIENIKDPDELKKWLEAENEPLNRQPLIQKDAENDRPGFF